MDLSVIVSTHNRSESLMRLLKSLEDLEIPQGLAWEVLIIDNNSTDQTRAVVETFIKNGCRNFRYIFERRQGKSFALNTGIDESRGEILAFTDDDVIVDKDWIAKIADEFKSNEDVVMLFGQTKPYSRDLPKVSTKESNSKEFYVFPDSPWRMGHGNNMVMRRSVVDHVGYFDVSLGPGTKIASADDTDFVYRVLASKQKLLYSPSPVVFHNHNRVLPPDLRMIEFNYAKGRGAFYCKHILRGDIWVAKLLHWEMRRLLKSFVGSREMSSAALRNLGGLLSGSVFRLWYETKRVLAVRP